MARKQQKSKEHFLAVPNHVLNIEGLARGPKLLLAHIYSFGRKGCWQNNETLAKMFFVCERTITDWIAKLKGGGHILWASGKGYHRTLWVKSHPDVRAAVALPYRGKDVPKKSLVSGQAGSAPPSRNLPGESAENCAVSTQKRVIPPSSFLLQTNNTTREKTKPGTRATPPPLPAGGQAPALLDDRKREMVATVRLFPKSFGRSGDRAGPLSPEEFERRRQENLQRLRAGSRRAP